VHVSSDRSIARFRLFLNFSGLSYIILAAPLMVPEFCRNYLAWLCRLNGFLSLGGEEPVVPSGGVLTLLINTAGIDFVLIGVFVIYTARNPVARWFIPAVNALGRSLFTGVIGHYVIVYDIARIVLLVGILDVSISALFLSCLFLLRTSVRAQDTAR